MISEDDAVRFCVHHKILIEESAPEIDIPIKLNGYKTFTTIFLLGNPLKKTAIRLKLLILRHTIKVISLNLYSKNS